MSESVMVYGHPLYAWCALKRWGRRRAFSSMEFMAAVVLSMIMSVIGLAGYKLYERQMPVDYTTKRLVHAFSSARAYAIAKNTTCAVRIDLEHRNFWIDETDAFGRTTVPKVTAPERFDDRVELAVYSGLRRLPDPGLNIVFALFYPDGSSSTVRLYFKLEGTGAEARDFYTIKLYGPTGQSKVFEKQRLD